MGMKSVAEATLLEKHVMHCVMQTIRKLTRAGGSVCNDVRNAAIVVPRFDAYKQQRHRCQTAANAAIL